MKCTLRQTYQCYMTPDGEKQHDANKIIVASTRGTYNDDPSLFVFFAVCPACEREFGCQSMGSVHIIPKKREFFPHDNARVISPNCIDCDATVPSNHVVGERYRERCRECSNAHRIASATEAQTAALAAQTAAANAQAKELAKIAVNQTGAIQRLAEAFQSNTEAMVAIRKQLRRNRKLDTMKTDPPTPPPPGLFDRVATIATGIGVDEMAVRAVARQMRKLVKEPIVAALAARSDTSQFVSTARAFLGTEFGDAALSLVMSAAVRYIPVVPQDWREPLAREFVVEGGASVIDTLADVFAAPIREAFSNAAGTLANPNIFPPRSSATLFDVKPVADESAAVPASNTPR